MEKLIPVTDFVLENQDKVLNSELGLLTYRYANFLKQPLKLEMFVPCVNGEPFNYSKHGNAEEYEQAKDKVLFEGIDLDTAKFHIKQNRNIEYLSQFGTLELTESAIKQIGL